MPLPLLLRFFPCMFNTSNCHLLASINNSIFAAITHLMMVTDCSTVSVEEELQQEENFEMCNECQYDHLLLFSCHTVAWLSLWTWKEHGWIAIPCHATTLNFAYTTTLYMVLYEWMDECRSVVRPVYFNGLELLLPI